MLQCVCVTHENLVQLLSLVPLSVAMQSVIALQWPWNSSGWLNCGASYKRSGRTIIIMTWYSGLDSWPIKVGKSAMISHSSRHGDFGNDWLLKCHLAEFTCRYRHVLRPSLIPTTRNGLNQQLETWNSPIEDQSSSFAHYFSYFLLSISWPHPFWNHTRYLWLANQLRTRETTGVPGIDLACLATCW